MLEDICNNAGVHIVTGAKIAKITADAVVLEDGTEYEAQLVIMSTGMRPYTKVAEDSGIAVDKWVVADSGMRTNVPDVFAAGDCIIVNGQPQAFWAQAVATGRVAGANAAGDSLEYEKLGSSLVMEVCGTSVFALGTNGKDPDREFRAVEKMDQEAGLYEKYYFYEGRLEGVILVGDISKMGEMTERIAEKAAYGDMFD
jgi:NAD(P)H-nitrite reductase large subunit